MTHRRKFPRRVYWGILRQQKLLCACGCGIKLTAKEGYEFDHDRSLGLGGADSSDNLRAVRVPCHARKSRLEAGMRAKADRQRRFHLGAKKRRGRKIQSRGFTKWQKFNGEIVVRSCFR